MQASVCCSWGLSPAKANFLAASRAGGGLSNGVSENATAHRVPRVGKTMRLDIDIVPPPGPWSARWPPPGWTCLEHLPKEAIRWHPYKMPEPRQLASFYAKEQRLYS